MQMRCQMQRHGGGVWGRKSLPPASDSQCEHDPTSQVWCSHLAQKQWHHRPSLANQSSFVTPQTPHPRHTHTLSRGALGSRHQTLRLSIFTQACIPHWWVSQHKRGEMKGFHFRALRLIRSPHSGGYLRLMEIKGRKSLLYAPRRPPQTLSTLRGFAVLLRCPLLSAGPVPGSQDVVCFERRPNWHWLICLLHRAASRHSLKQQFKLSYWVWYQPPLTEKLQTFKLFV